MPIANSIEELQERIDLFLLGLRHPVLLEPGKEVMDLSTSSYSLSTEYNKLLWHVWDEHTNFVRQIVAIQKEKPGRMEIRFQKFGKGPPGTLILADSRAEEGRLERRSQRARYTRVLRQTLSQLFPEWKIRELSSEPDLEHSFSGRYTRGLITHGQRAWAVIGTEESDDPTTAEEILTYGLLWLDWLRQKKADQAIAGLKIFCQQTGQPPRCIASLGWTRKRPNGRCMKAEKKSGAAIRATWAT